MKVKRANKRLLIGVPLVVVFLLTVLAFSVALADDPPEPSDVTANLTSVTLTVKQGENTVAPGGEIASGDPISVKVSFGVPVEGDEPTPDNPVQKGDTAVFELSNAFTLVSGTTVELKAGDILVGHVAFTTGTGGMVIATVTFDGDDEVFDGTSDSIECWFTAELQYDHSGDAGNEGKHEVTILDKTFTVVVPAAPTEYKVTKAGTIDLEKQQVDWIVTVTGTKSGSAVDLGGTVFVDNLVNVGNYVSGSFKVGGTTPVPGPTYSGNILSYEFPTGSTSPQTATFSTKITDAKYFGTGQQSITNLARLTDDEAVQLATGSKTVTFTPEWIEKAGEADDGFTGGGVYDPTGRTITWTITANLMELSLTNAVITDVLPTGLTWQSAKWQLWGGTAWGAATNVNDEPTDGKYELGNINTKVLLTVVAKVPDQNPSNPVTGVTTYYNSATLSWHGMPAGAGSGPGTGDIGVGIGFTALTKSGTADASTGQITWTVNVDVMGQSIPNLKVYDLLVYGDSIDLSDLTVTGIPSGVTRSDLTPRYHQKYIDGSFSLTTGAGALTNVHAIEQDGVRVGDLLEITGLSAAAANTFTFKTQILDPAIFAGNTSTTVSNTASLFSENTWLNAATGSVTYVSRLLQKEMLKRGTNPADTAGANDWTSGASQGFDYVDKSVVFRLSVNNSGMDLPNKALNAAGDKMGKVIVTDTLPKGWEFVPFGAGGPDYLIYNGTAVSNSNSVTATGNPLSPVPTGLTYSITPTTETTGETITFTFTALAEPYVILVKAMPTDDALNGYFGKNQTTTVSNNVKLHTENWQTGVSDSQSVSITSELLAKDAALVEAGVLRWTLEYRPYELGLGVTGNLRLEDTLDLGIDLRTDSTGALDFSGGNITVHKLTLNSNGTYSLGAELSLPTDMAVTYNNETRILSFPIADVTQAYRFTYLTDITGNPGTTVSNKVKLIGEGVVQGAVDDAYEISDADGGASLNRGGWIEITKVDGANGALLSGAEFTIFASDGTTVIRTGVTGSNGTLRLKVIPNGTYTLKETNASDGYFDEGRVWSLTVAGGVASIDGKTGDDSNKLTVANYLEGTVGKLTISKVVAGTDGDPSREFTFTVTFTGEGASGEFDYIGNGVPNGTIKSGDTISLAHGQSITIVGLPKDIEYTVNEADYTEHGYRTVSTGDAGSIVADETQTAAFTNTRNKPGSLTIVKTVGGNAGSTLKRFSFTVTFTGPGTSGEFDYIGNGVPNGTIKSGDTISLAHGQSITIEGLPEGTSYAVAEDDYSGAGYVTVSTGSIGSITAEGTHVAAFTNTRNVVFPPQPQTGGLAITKTVGGNAGDTSKLFAFTVEFEFPDSHEGGADASFEYIGNGVAGGTIKSGGTIYLAHGQGIKIVGLPAGTKYTVTEADHSGDGYVTSSTGDTGTVVAGGTRVAAFTNTRSVAPPEPENGSLTISKTVGGNAGDTSRKFALTVTFTGEGTSGEFDYIGNGIPNGAIKSGDTIYLAHGQSITIVGLPAGTAYTVTEADYSGDEYITSSTGSPGVIVGDAARTAAFTNTRNVLPPEQETGRLTVGKKVSGNQADQNREFTFVVEVSAPGTFGFTGSKTGTIANGGTITLKHGEHIVIEGLPVGTTYRVTEKEANTGGYKTTVTGGSGTITVQGQTAAFVNTKDDTTTGGGSTTPETGDSGHMMLWIIGLIGFVALLAALVSARLGLRRR